MERLLLWIRENPQFAAIGIGALMVGLVLGLLATVMAKSGASLRPIIWFAGFFAIIAGPQAVVHLLDGFVLSKSAASFGGARPEAKPKFFKANPGPSPTPVPWSEVFGPKADPMLITDAKVGLAAILGNATEAKLSFNTEGESALAAKFSSPADTISALNTYGNFFAFAQAQGSDEAGWTARRHGGQGEWVHIVAAGPELYAWTGATRDAVTSRRPHGFGPFVEPADGTMENSASKSAPLLISRRLATRPMVMIGIVSLNLFAAVGWFFKGSVWAARVEAAPVTVMDSSDSVAKALLAMDSINSMTAVARLPDGALEVTWRYADARWWDLMRVHQLRRVHRLVLHLDESSHTVRVREYWSAFDASAGVGGMRLNWQANSGIQFFAVEHKRVFGAQLDAEGRFTGELSKGYTFNLQELKAPLIDITINAGWNWQPVTWNAPAFLRWLTE